jgi:hypothetical protein
MTVKGIKNLRVNRAWRARRHAVIRKLRESCAFEVRQIKDCCTCENGTTAFGNHLIVDEERTTDRAIALVRAVKPRQPIVFREVWLQADIDQMDQMES